MGSKELIVIILTYNEGIHLARCIASVLDVASSILVVDSFSTDNTREVVEKYGATFVQNVFVNQAQQFNFALTIIPSGFKWVLRIDADEYLSPSLAESIAQVIKHNDSHDGFYLKRRMAFGGRLINYGGIFPVEVLRLFRAGRGICEERWMDEHILVSGKVGSLQGELIDDNLNTLTWWIQKHNQYSNREAVEILLRRNKLRGEDDMPLAGRAGLKRLVKDKIYAHLPVVPKVLAYFLYRYVFRFGFLDGKQGFAFHFLQGFWYRFLVEAKVREVERYMAANGDSLDCAAKKILGIKL